MTEPRYLLFRSFPFALVVTAIFVVTTGFSIRHIGSPPTALTFAGTRFAAYSYVMTGFSAIVLVQWITAAQVKLEKYFFSLWLVVIAVGTISLHHSSPMLVAGQCAVALLNLAATFVAVRITIDIARPLYREAQVARGARESK